MDDIYRHLNTLVSILQDPILDAEQLPLPLFEYITNNFSVVLGSGGSGTVYKGLLPNDKVVAVKRLHINRRLVDDNAFDAEVASMKKLRHKNVVRLLSYCIHMEEQEILYKGEKIVAQKRERLLCMEFVPNGPVKKGGILFYFLVWFSISFQHIPNKIFFFHLLPSLPLYIVRCTLLHLDY